MNKIDSGSDVVCIYHANCADGTAAAWVVRRKYPGATFIPMNYGDTLALSLIEDKTIYIVDFSFPPETLTQMLGSAKYITVIDHHKTAIDKLKGYSNPYAKLILEDGRAGCVLTWDYFFGDREAPAWLCSIGDRDVWKFHLPYTKDICAYIQSQPVTFDWLDEIHSTPYTTLTRIGKVIYDSQVSKMHQRIDTCAYRTTVLGHNVPTINVHPSENASELLHELAKGEPFAVGWYHSRNYIHYSFRSDKDGEDVARIAEQLGGGGHKHAAGWRINRI